MSVYNSSVSPVKTLTVTLATASWTALGPDTIGSVESIRYGRTLISANFPTYSLTPSSVVYIEKCVTTIRNTSGASKTINFKLYKNDAQVYSGSASLSTNQYMGITGSFLNVVVGDKCELAVWCTTTTNVKVVGHLKHVVITKLLPTAKPCISVSYTFGLYTYPSPLTSENTSPSYEYIGDSIATSVTTTLTRSFVCLSFVSQNSYNLFRNGVGDYAGSNVVLTSNNGSNQNIKNAYYPTTITYREIDL